MRGSGARKKCLGLLCMTSRPFGYMPLGILWTLNIFTRNRMHGQEVHANVVEAGPTAPGYMHD